MGRDYARRPVRLAVCRDGGQQHFLLWCPGSEAVYCGAGADRPRAKSQLCPSGNSECPSRWREVEATADIRDTLHPAAGALGRSNVS